MASPPPSMEASPSSPRVVLKLLGARNVGIYESLAEGLAPAAIASNIYCHVQCGEDGFKTDVMEQTTAPVWDQEVTFGVSQALGESVVFELFASVEGEDDKPLGATAIVLDSLPADAKQQQTLPVMLPGGSGAVGELIVDVLLQTTPPPQVDSSSSASTPAPASESAPDSTPTPALVPVSGSAEPLSSAGGAEISQPPPALSSEPSSSAIVVPPSQPPNVIAVTVLEAMHLKPKDGSGAEATSDPVVKLSCSGNSSQKTKVQKQTLHPKWRQTFYFVLTKKQTLELMVEDEDMLSNDTQGHCVIDIDQWRAQFGDDKQVVWVALDYPTSGGDKELSDISSERKLSLGHGKICIAVEMRHIDRKLADLEQGELDHVTAIPPSRNTRILVAGNVGGAQPGEEVEDAEENAGGDAEGVEGAPAAEEEDEIEQETEEEIKKREEEQEKMMSELANVQLASGDYQIRVRIIEVRDLKPMDLNGTCDPVVSVECMGQQQHTVVKKNQLSCVFDEYLNFNFRRLDHETAQQGSINITVRDADAPAAFARSSKLAALCSDTIGFFAVDIPYVYYQKDHELNRKWVALAGCGKDNADSIQGYLLLSIIVLGPGDRLRIHRAEEERDTNNMDVASKKDINALVIVPPRVVQKQSYLVVTIFQVQDLPDMDQTIIKKGGIDGYVRVYFAGQDMLDTKTVTEKGSGSLSVEYNQELWFPVMLPTMSNNIFISMWDYDLAADQLVGKINPYLFSQVQEYPNQFKPHWANLYGPPIGYVTESKAREHMFNHPRTAASTYRGRVLLSMRIEDGNKSVNDRAHTRNLIAVMPSTHTKAYSLRAALFFGTEVPMFASKTSWGRNSRMGLKISIGKHEVLTSRVDNMNGICHWNQYVDITDVKLPADLSQAPDVFVHLVRKHMNETRCVCFARFRAADVFFSSESIDELRNIPAPQWVSFIEDSVVNDLKDHDFTGNVLMSLRLAPTQSDSFAKELSQRWREFSSKSLTYTKYTILAHVFQAKRLAAADSNGLLDPYIKVACSGVEGLVNKRTRTRDPCFYETVKLDVDLPQDKTFLPKLSVQVFDYDKWDTDDYVGVAKFNLADFEVTPSSIYAKKKKEGKYSPPRPKWYPIHYLKEGDTEGELLLSFDIIRKENPGSVVEPPESIRPPTEEKFVEIIALGCRGLQPLGFMPVNSPWAKFEVGEISKTNEGRFTNPSSKPSSQNPNFLERIVIPVRLPVDALYAPRLMIQVFDQHLGGFYKPIIGVASIDLSSKMPLSNGKLNPEYVGVGESVYSGNPYVEQRTDYSTFPGTIPPTLTQPVPQDATESAEETKQDSGAGAIPAELLNKASLVSDFDGDEGDDTPHYLRDRDMLEDSLEDKLERSPFETYTLFRGDMIVRKNLLTGNKAEPSYHPVGCFKGLVRILNRRDDLPLVDLDQFLKPEPYLVRVYVLDALQLQPKDENNKCDPYLRISVGDGRKRHHLINDRDNHKLATVSPKFHQMYEFKATLPGASELRVEVLDYDFFAIPGIPTGISNGLKNVGANVGGDDFIGATLIDLEDRWFSAKWQQLGGNVPSHEKRKPVETRPLYAPFSTLEQGRVRLWVDILTPTEMKIAKPWDVSLPPSKPFEVRVIVYRARGVTPGDFTDLTDLYVKTWLQSRDDLAQTTDTHWRARDGKASFNWRMKFPLELPIDPENEADKGYLHMQLWDKDLLYNDCLADTVVDLTAFLKLAYKTHQTVDVFAKKRQQRLPSTNTGPTLMPASSSQSDYGTGRTTLATEVSIHVDEDVKVPLLTASQSVRSGPPSSKTTKKPQEQKKEKAESLVQSFKQRLGMGGEPEGASWLTFTTRDPVTGDRVRCGELLVSVEILPFDIANARAAGLGRSEPNNFPFLPEPADRLHLSAMWNPMYVLEALIGPKYYRAFTSALVCGCFVAIVIFAGPLVNFFLTLLEIVPKPYGLIIFATLLALLVLSFAYFTYRCRSAIRSSKEEAK